MKFSIPLPVIEAPELDGCGKLMLSIVTKCARKTGLNDEDLFQEAMIYYLRHKHKHDTSRGARTTFVHQLMRSFCNWKAREILCDKRREPSRLDFNKLVASSKATPWLDTDAQAIADAGLLGVVRSVGGVAQQMSWSYERAESALTEMKQAYAKRKAAQVWVDKEPA